jgi:hypothetical protein
VKDLELVEHTRFCASLRMTRPDIRGLATASRAHHPPDSSRGVASPYYIRVDRGPKDHKAQNFRIILIY